jgi:hypothetical protein
MMTNCLKDYLAGIGARSLPPCEIPEEREPDLPTATSSSSAREMICIEIDPFPDPDASPLFDFFIDGVQRTVAVAEVIVDNMHVPLHLSHLIVGAMKRVEKKLIPFIMREALVLIFPFQALQAAGWSACKPPGQELSSSGGIYGKVKKAKENGDLLYSDSSIALRLERDGRPQILLEAGDLIRTGEVRQKALDRAKELLRIMELGLLWELRCQYPNEWVLLDGPIAPLLKYGRLTEPSLAGLQNIAKPDIAFELLRRVVGAVKTVRIVAKGIERALTLEQKFCIPIYQFAGVVKEDDEVAKEILSAFLWLRRELVGEISTLWSTVSGLARFDIPIPAVFDDSGKKNNWNNLNEDTIKNCLTNPSSKERQRLEELLQAIVIERWPVPAATATRMLTELFPIAETECWLTSQLRNIHEMRFF